MIFYFHNLFNLIL